MSNTIPAEQRGAMDAAEEETYPVMGAFTRDTRDSDALDAKVLSVALIGPDEARRHALADAIRAPQAVVAREFPSYPSLDDVPKLADSSFDVIIVELDQNPEQALDFIEQICGQNGATVMVYTARPQQDLLVRSMRAGAREFLSEPFSAGSIAEALVRASSRRPASHPVRKAIGQLLVFVGAKGGSGTTTIASNFAVALAQESERSTVLIDLDLPLGDAALNLGVQAQFSTANALENHRRLDSNFLATLLAKHISGLSVLAAPDRYIPVEAAGEAAAKLLLLARQDFDFVVVDGGSGAVAGYAEILEAATAIYLVTQVTISELRNSNRLIEQFSNGRSEFRIVLNRYMPRSLEIDDAHIAKALTRMPDWKIPSDYPAVRRAQNTATALALENSPVSRAIRRMARVACGLPADPEKRKGFHLFG